MGSYLGGGAGQAVCAVSLSLRRSRSAGRSRLRLTWLRSRPIPGPTSRLRYSVRAGVRVGPRSEPGGRASLYGASNDFWFVLRSSPGRTVAGRLVLVDSNGSLDLVAISIDSTWPRHPSMLPSSGRSTTEGWARSRSATLPAICATLFGTQSPDLHVRRPSLSASPALPDPRHDRSCTGSDSVADANVSNAPLPASPPPDSTVSLPWSTPSTSTLHCQAYATPVFLSEDHKMELGLTLGRLRRKTDSVACRERFAVGHSPRTPPRELFSRIGKFMIAQDMDGARSVVDGEWLGAHLCAVVSAKGSEAEHPHASPALVRSVRCADRLPRISPGLSAHLGRPV